MTKYFTGKGDQGSTGLPGNRRVAKNNLIIDTLGSIDESNAALGLARSLSKQPDTAATLLIVQRCLYLIMSEVAASSETQTASPVSFDEKHVIWLEEHIEMLTKKIPTLSGFIVPGDSISGAALDVARTVVRRAERRIVDLFDADLLSNLQILRYLNRLSSLCFVLELYEYKSSGALPTLAKE